MSPRPHFCVFFYTALQDELKSNQQERGRGIPAREYSGSELSWGGNGEVSEVGCRARKALTLSAIILMVAACGSTFSAPKAVRHIMLMSDTASGLLYLPTRPAKVAREIETWLRDAVPVTSPDMPANQPVLHAYLGPAQLSFKDASSGQWVTVSPAFYLAGSGRVSVHLFPDIVAYRYGDSSDAKVVYLRDPPLYRYLTHDPSWHAQFHPDVTKTPG